MRFERMSYKLIALFAISIGFGIFWIFFSDTNNGNLIRNIESQLYNYNEINSYILNQTKVSFHKRCEYGDDCDDNSSCTRDSCFSNICFNIREENTCLSNDDCDEFSKCNNCQCSTFCTTLSCNIDKKCSVYECFKGDCHLSYIIPGCCETDNDCNDSNVCTIDKCFNFQCLNSKIGRNGCSEDSDCNTGFICTNCACQSTGGSVSNDTNCTVDDLCYQGDLLQATSLPVPETLVLRDSTGSSQFLNITIGSSSKRSSTLNQSVLSIYGQSSFIGSSDFGEIPTVGIGNFLIDTESTQIIPGVKNLTSAIIKYLTISGNINITGTLTSNNPIINITSLFFNTTFTSLPNFGLNNQLLDQNSHQSIIGNKDFISNVTFLIPPTINGSIIALLNSNLNQTFISPIIFSNQVIFLLPPIFNTTGFFNTSSTSSFNTSNLVDLTSQQTINGKKYFISDVTFLLAPTINGSTIALLDSNLNQTFISPIIFNNQVIFSIPPIFNTTGFFNISTSTGSFNTSNLVDLTSQQTIDGEKDFISDVTFLLAPTINGSTIALLDSNLNQTFISPVIFNKQVIFSVPPIFNTTGFFNASSTSSFNTSNLVDLTSQQTIDGEKDFISDVTFLLAPTINGSMIALLNSNLNQTFTSPIIFNNQVIFSIPPIFNTTGFFNASSTSSFNTSNLVDLTSQQTIDGEKDFISDVTFLLAPTINGSTIALLNSNLNQTFISPIIFNNQVIFSIPPIFNTTGFFNTSTSTGSFNTSNLVDLTSIQIITGQKSFTLSPIFNGGNALDDTNSQIINGIWNYTNIVSFGSNVAFGILPTYNGAKLLDNTNAQYINGIWNYSSSVFFSSNVAFSLPPTYNGAKLIDNTNAQFISGIWNYSAPVSYNSNVAFNLPPTINGAKITDNINAQFISGIWNHSAAVYFSSNVAFSLAPTYNGAKLIDNTNSQFISGTWNYSAPVSYSSSVSFGSMPTYNGASLLDNTNTQFISGSWNYSAPISYSSSVLFGSMPTYNGASLVDNTNDQTIGGNWLFTNKPTLSTGTLLDTSTSATISATYTFASKPLISGSGFVDITTNMNVGGSKTFTGSTTFSGSVALSFIPTLPSSNSLVDFKTAQTILALKTFNPGVAFSGSTNKATLGDYSESSQSLTFSIGSGTPVTKVVPGCTFTKVGRMVNVYIPSFTVTTPTSGTQACFTTSFPSGYYGGTNAPTGALSRVQDNGSNQVNSGYWFLSTAGVLSLCRDNTGSTTFTANAVGGFNTNINMNYAIV